MNPLIVSTILALITSEPALRLERLGRLDHEAIREASGIVASRRHAGVFWVLNDSGNPPQLFAVRRDGALIREFSVAVPNIDWEDLTTDDAGHLYIGEIGNNGARLPLRAIYRVDEPDPDLDGPEGKLTVTAGSYYRMNPDERFDAEGLFLDGGRAIVVAKTFDERPAGLFAVPIDPPAPLLRPARPEKVGVLPGFIEPVTGAGLSRDGRRLAACSYDVARVYEREGTGADRWQLLASIAFEGEGDGIEAIAWDGDDLVLAGEGRGLFRISATTWRAAARPHTDRQEPPGR